LHNQSHRSKFSEPS